ncbi:MAG: P-loop NTPase [Spirochaetales bacterium]|nr:P-loop NTPase [Spirochaetales bacterium]
MVQKEDVLKALSEIIDPDLGKDIVTLGFIKELVISGSKVSFAIELTTPACPLKNQFREAAEKLVGEIEGVEKVNVTMTARNARDQKSENGLKNVKQIIAVASAKGGVGKSTVAATVACELRDRGYKTGLLDTDLFGPSVPTLFNISHPEVYQRDNMLIPMEKEGLKLMSFGFLMGDAPAIMRGPMVSGYMQQILLQVDWGELDYLVIDMPPGTGDIQLTLSQTIQVDGAVIVTTRAALSLVDVSRGILMFEKVGVPMLGVVENMSHFICDSCDKEHYIFGEAKAPGERFGLETLAQIPLEPGRGRNMVNYSSNDINKSLVDNIARALGKATAEKIDPPEVVQEGETVLIKWKDKEDWTVNAVHLRSSCRCALCVDEYTGEKILNDEDIPLDIRVESATALGNYALSISWSDGHSSGIFPYSQLQELSK